MPKKPFRDVNTVRIAPGEHCAIRQGEVISTLLGSCVAACLYDQETGIAGMNHFLLSNRRYARDLPFTETEAGRYGIHAMELLINDMIDYGVTRKNLRAKVFGGASIIDLGPSKDNFACVGAVNSRFIMEYLRTEHIPVLASDLGGDHGRIIYFDTRDYSVYVQNIGKSDSVVLAKRDRSLWQHELKEHEVFESTADLTAPHFELWR